MPGISARRVLMASTSLDCVCAVVQASRGRASRSGSLSLGFRPHRDVRPADLTDRHPHFRKLQHDLLGLFFYGDRFVQRHTRQAQRSAGSAPPSRIGMNSPDGRQQVRLASTDRRRTQQHGGAMVQRPPKHRLISRLHPAGETSLLRMVAAQDQRGEDRGQGQRHDHRGQQEMTRYRPGARTFCLPCRARSSGQKDDADDENAEQDRLPDSFVARSTTSKRDRACSRFSDKWR